MATTPSPLGVRGESTTIDQVGPLAMETAAFTRVTPLNGDTIREMSSAR